MLELAFQADREAREPLYLQLADYLRELVAAGRLASGEKLPATRELAASLRLSRNTVTQAYQCLIDDGLLSSHVGQGSFVTARRAALRAAARGAAAQAEERPFAWEALISRRARALEPSPAGGPRPEALRFDFRGGQVDPSTLPSAALKRAYARAIQRALPALGRLVHPFGWPPLREQIARSLVARGIRCGAEDVVVTSGAQHGLSLLGQVLLDPGDAVAVEQPGYFGAAAAFRAARAELVGIEVDAEGLRVDQLARALRSRRIKLVYTTPSAQHPTGVVLSGARRRALLALADEQQLPVLEDDYDSELRYGDPPLPALKTRDPAGQVLYLGTFSKALFPGLRLGYLVGARPVLARLARLRFSQDFGSDALAQAAVAELLASGALERHLRRLRRLYGERRAAMLEALRASLPEGARLAEPRGGHAVWLALPSHVDPEAVYADACRAGITYMRGELAYLPGASGGARRGRHELALAFVNQDVECIREGVQAFARIVSRHAAHRRSA